MPNFFSPKHQYVKYEKINISVNIKDFKNIKFKIIANELNINWGDGETDSTFTEHEYKESKQYNIMIYGTFITEFHASNCNISELVFTHCKYLCILDCAFNELKYLDLSKCNDLEKVKCNDNQIKSLELNNLKYLFSLICCYNQIATLFLNKASNLNYLDFENNKVTKLHLKDAINLALIKCNHNPLTLKEINKNLPKRNSCFYPYVLYIDKNQENPEIEKKIIRKEWSIKKVSDY